ncbi:hypothetical protein QJS04_geneDACA024081 [Acorus gramineus]|uniref:Uncharacterized protein n=1 Tax=Acorus gramineus TaxID=55184 RepID=A0AAV9AYP9_ACOGR|nr:hypothetical protein QJS04_geneDACA024081 [Acorus gramineus]
MTTKASSPNRFIRYMKAPLRALVRARDLYVQSMTGCASRAHYRRGMVVSTLPKSYSTNSWRQRDDVDDDVRELIRLASLKKAAHSLTVPSASSLGGGSGGGAVRGVPRNRSVNIGRIDEDMPYDGGDDVMVGAATARMFPRSQSHAVPMRTAMVN